MNLAPIVEEMIAESYIEVVKDNTTPETKFDMVTANLANGTVS